MSKAENKSYGFIVVKVSGSVNKVNSFSLNGKYGEIIIRFQSESDVMYQHN